MESIFPGTGRAVLPGVAVRAEAVGAVGLFGQIERVGAQILCDLDAVKEVATWWWS